MERNRHIVPTQDVNDGTDINDSVETGANGHGAAYATPWPSMN